VHKDGEPDCLVRWGQGRQLLVGAQPCTVQVEQAQADGSYSVLEIILEPGAPATLLHAHCALADTYLVRQGDVVGTMGQNQVRAGPGSAPTCLPASRTGCHAVGANRPSAGASPSAADSPTRSYCPYPTLPRGWRRSWVGKRGCLAGVPTARGTPNRRHSGQGHDEKH
jgi:hypothetical protein